MMNNINNNQEKIYEIWKQSQTEVSKEASDKSLSAFQEGLKGVEGEYKKRRKIQKPRRKLPGIIGGTVVAALTFLLIFNTGLLNTNEESATEESEKVIPEEVEEENIAEELMEKALNRPHKVVGLSDRLPTHGIFNQKLDIQLPDEWKVFETKESDDIYTQMTSLNNEKMKLIMFQNLDDMENMNARVDELIHQFEATEEVTLPIKELTNRLKEKYIYSSIYRDIFPFEQESVELRVLYNETNNSVMEIYVSKLFGYPMIFTSEFNFDSDMSWINSVLFFSQMMPNGMEQDINGSIGELDEFHRRPLEKEVLLSIGAIGTEQVEVELYDNEELGLTSYITKTTEVERVEYEYFVEWKFTEPDVPEGSFISIGKLKEDFPMNNAAETLLSASGIDMSFYEEREHEIPDSHYIEYNDNDNYMNGHFELFEVDGEWYYSRHHGDFRIYNGGTYYQRQKLLMESIEWY